MAEYIYLGSVSCITALVFLKNSQHNHRTDKNENDSDSEKTGDADKERLRSLQNIYLPAHLLGLFSDWLQGPYVYQLYREYGHGEKEIAVLFMTGYISSCLLGGFTGPLADKYGRRRLGQIFCVLCILNCLSKISANFYVLLLGRLLSGVSTSCLYSVFESWYVNEHKSRHIPNSLLSSTMSMVTTCNSALAITAGLLCDLMVRQASLPVLAPFLAAVPCLAAALLVITSHWPENFGNSGHSLLQMYKEGVSFIISDYNILKIGLVQATVESSMFIFVYLWTPTLSAGQSSVPLGIIFSTFMISIMLGSFLFRRQISSGQAPERVLVSAVLLYLFCHLVAGLTADQAGVCPFQRQICFIAFIVLEMCLGLYFPALATLRSVILPSSHRSTIINLFRIPLNLITVAILYSIKQGIVEAKFHIFAINALLVVIAFFASRTINAKKDKVK